MADDKLSLAITFDRYRDGNVVEMVVYHDNLIVACEYIVWCFNNECWQMINARDGSWTEQMVDSF